MPPKTKKIRYGKWETTYRGILFDIKQRDVFFPDGTVKKYEFSVREDSVVILPFDKQGRLLLIHEYRIPPNKYVYFLPAGRMDKRRESPSAAAIRELREETGYTADKIKLFRKSSAAGHSIWSSYIFAAKDLRPAPLGGDEEMKIKVCPVSMEKAVKMALDGDIPNEFISYNILVFDYLVKSGQWKW